MPIRAVEGIRTTSLWMQNAIESHDDSFSVIPLSPEIFHGILSKITLVTPTADTALTHPINKEATAWHKIYG